MRFFITGDTHRGFERVEALCADESTTKDDVLIILGDVGINYFLDEKDYELKCNLSALPITLLCIHGNHEERPFLIDGYEEREWHGGIVYAEQEFPNLLFAKDGEIYDLCGEKAVAIGGAYSVDKEYRLMNGLNWFSSEQPDDEIKSYVESQLTKANWCVDYVFSHCAPGRFEPRWAFVPGKNQALIDKTTEKWLDTIEQRLDYVEWYCGHYHIDEHYGQMNFMFNDIELLTED